MAPRQVPTVRSQVAPNVATMTPRQMPTVRPIRPRQQLSQAPSRGARSLKQAAPTTRGSYGTPSHYAMRVGRF
jgi:hypothetical protein